MTICEAHPDQQPRIITGAALISLRLKLPVEENKVDLEVNDLVNEAGNPFLFHIDRFIIINVKHLHECMSLLSGHGLVCISQFPFGDQRDGRLFHPFSQRV